MGTGWYWADLAHREGVGRDFSHAGSSKGLLRICYRDLTGHIAEGRGVFMPVWSSVTRWPCCGCCWRLA